MKTTALFALPLLVSCATLEQPVEPAASPFSETATALDGSSAPDAIEAAADAYDVPADLLAAIAWVETGFATPRVDAGWLGLDASQQSDIVALLGVSHAELHDRSTNLLAGAAWLDHLRDQHAPFAGEEADSSWWPAVAAWSGSSAHAADVYAVLQSGMVAWTDETLDALDLPLDSDVDEAVITIPPRAIERLDHPIDIVLSEAVDYPGSVGASMHPSSPRTDPVHHVELQASGDSFTASISADAHYVVNRRDGAVVQTLREGDGGDAIVVSLAAPDTSFAAWSAPLLEGAARLAVDVARRHGLDPAADIDTSALGGSFPRSDWRAMVGCIAADQPGCGGAVGLPVDEPVVDVAPAGDDERDGAVPDVPYFYQYANALNPSATCQNTSVAMVLNHVGWSGTPDDITRRFGKNLAQSPGGLAQVFNTLASEAGLSARITPHTSGSIEGLRALLNAGKPTIIHGYMTSYGHVVVALKYTGSHYVVNDPAGRWAQSWKGSYPYGWSSSGGKAISYSRAAFEQAVATSNGSSYLPLWYHELTGVDAADLPAADPEPEPEPEPADPIGDDPTSGTTPPDGDTTPDGAYSATADVAVELLEPRHGETIGNPMTVLARRSGGASTEITSGAWTLVEPTTAAILDESVTIWSPGERVVTARALSEWGTVLASHTVRVWVEDVASMEVGARMLGGMEAEMTASTGASDVAWVEYSVDGWALRDSETGDERASGAGFPLHYSFTASGEHRLLVGRGYDADGDLVAEGEAWIDVTGDASGPGPSATSCAIQGEMSCGDVVSGDTSSAEASDSVDSYTDTVGIWDAPEMAWTFNGSGTVKVGFVNPRPSELNLDIMILETTSGTCQGDQLLAIAWNALEFEALANKTYVFVVDGYNGAMGAFEMYVECS